MTDQDQIVALAELEGVTDVAPYEGPFHRARGKLRGIFNCQRVWVPDYLNDLNAVHRVKSKLTDAEYDLFIWELRCVCAEQRDGRVKTSMMPQRDEWRGLLEADGRQLSEAILRATNRWKESP